MGRASHDFEKRIKQLEEGKQKRMEQISFVGVKNYQRKQEHAKERNRRECLT